MSSLLFILFSSILSSLLFCIIFLRDKPKSIALRAGSNKSQAAEIRLTYPTGMLPIIDFGDRDVDLMKDNRYILGEVFGNSCEGYGGEVDIKDKSLVLIDSKFAMRQLQEGDFIVLQDVHTNLYKIRRFTGKSDNSKTLFSTTIKDGKIQESNNGMGHAIGIFERYNFTGKIIGTLQKPLEQQDRLETQVA